MTQERAIASKGALNLKLRVMTALVLAPAVLAGVVLLPLSYFALFIFVLAGLGLYEWAALTGFAHWAGKLAYVGVCGACIFLLWTRPDWWAMALAAVCVFWVMACVFVVGYPVGRALVHRRAWMALSGVVVFSGAWLGLVVLKQQAAGHWLVIWVLIVVWAADIGAYFAGRAFGKRKLAPRVSPGKTWEGAFGGMSASLAFGAGLAWALGWLTGGWLAGGWIVLIVGLSVVSIFGDLFESAIKRAREVKDSGGLLPGHGGVLDRIDSIVAVAPVFALWVLV